LGSIHDRRCSSQQLIFSLAKTNLPPEYLDLSFAKNDPDAEAKMNIPEVMTPAQANPGVKTMGALNVRREPSSAGVSRRNFLSKSSILVVGSAMAGTRDLTGGAEASSIREAQLPGGLAVLDPHIAHLRKAYQSRAAEIFSNLKTVLGNAEDRSASARPLTPGGKSAVDAWSSYRYLLGTSRQLLDEALAYGGDNSVLFRLSVYLRRWKTVAGARDRHVIAVGQAWQDLQTIYLLKADSFEPNKPTVLFVHGSGTGPFPVFNGLFNEFAGSHNVAFFLYDHLEPVASIALRLDKCWSRFRKEQRLSRPAVVVDLSYGTTIFRYAVLTNETGLWQNGTLLEIAPVVLGSKYAKWFAACPLQKSFLQVLLPNLRHWADGVDGQAQPQRFIWTPENIAGFDRVVARRLSLVPERDVHLSSQARHHLADLLGPGKFRVMEGMKHNPAPGTPTVIAQASQFLGQS